MSKDLDDLKEFLGLAKQRKSRKICFRESSWEKWNDEHSEKLLFFDKNEKQLLMRNGEITCSLIFSKDMDPETLEWHLDRNHTLDNCYKETYYIQGTVPPERIPPKYRSRYVQIDKTTGYPVNLTAEEALQIIVEQTKRRKDVINMRGQIRWFFAFLQAGIKINKPLDYMARHSGVDKYLLVPIIKAGAKLPKEFERTPQEKKRDKEILEILIEQERARNERHERVSGIPPKGRKEKR